MCNLFPGRFRGEHSWWRFPYKNKIMQIHIKSHTLTYLRIHMRWGWPLTGQKMHLFYIYCMKHVSLCIFLLHSYVISSYKYLCMFYSKTTVDRDRLKSKCVIKSKFSIHSVEFVCTMQLFQEQLGHSCLVVINQSKWISKQTSWLNRAYFNINKWPTNERLFH